MLVRLVHRLEVVHASKENVNSEDVVEATA